MANLATVCGEMALVTEQPPYRALAVWALQAVRVQVLPQPNRAVSVVQQFGNWKINHAAMLPHVARWLHMSQHLNVRMVK